MSKKILRRIAIWIGALAVAFFGTVAIAVNFILTPERLTPIAQEIANEYVDGTVDIGAIDAVFFSSFPRSGVRIRNLTVVSNAYHQNPEDTIWTRRDTLLHVDMLRVGLNLGHFLATGEVAIGRVMIKNPTIALAVDENGVANWNIIKEITTDEDTLTVDTATTQMNITLKHLDIENARVTYGDMSTKTFFHADSLYLTADGDMNLKSLSIDLDISDKATYLAADGTRYLRKMPFGVNGHIAYDMENNRYELTKTIFSINKTKFGADGWLQMDSTFMDMDLKFGLKTPDATQLFEYIPKGMIQKELQISSGAVTFIGSIVGRMSETEKPVLTTTVEVSDIKARYEGMPHGIDDLNIKLESMLCQQTPAESYINLDIFHFEGGNSEVEATVRMNSALLDPTFNCTLKSHLDLNSLTEVFPIENTKMDGIVDADLAAEFRLKDVKDLNFGCFAVNGKLQFDSLSIVNDTLGINVETFARMKFASKDSVTVEVMVRDLKYSDAENKVALSGVKFDAGTILTRDTTKIAPLKASFKARRAFYKGDSIVVFTKNMALGGGIKASKSNPRRPEITTVFRTDTIFGGFEGTRGFVDKISFGGTFEKIDTLWYSKADFEVGEIRVGSPLYRLPITLSNTKISQENNLKKDIIKVERGKLRAGHSSAEFSGTMMNLFGYLREGKRMGTKFTIAADTLNCNELMAAIVEDDEEASKVLSTTASTDSSLVVTIADAETLETDSMTVGLIEIPKKLRVGFELSANHLVWNKLSFDKIHSNIEIQREAMHITNFMFKQGDSRAIITMAYKPKMDAKFADVKCFIRWERADIERLVKSLDLDTIIPALEPIKGEVDCYMAAEVEVDSLWNFDLNTTRAAVHLSAKSLTVMDGETFSKISKVLMFKNKEENVIDTVSLNMLVDSGKVELLPFVANVDRYRAVIGGSQDFDNNINYHVSIVKSPLPFKAGVNLTGNLDDMNIGVTTAKLKKMQDKATQLQNDTATLKVRLDILRKSYELSGVQMPEMLSVQ